MKDRTKILKRELKNAQSQLGTLERAVQIEPDFGLGEGDPAITSREVNRALLERLNDRVETLQRAISRVGKGSYGICLQCGNLIHLDRLAVLPDTRVCVRCAQTGEPV
jgi:DnaK suppressor protein